MLGTGCTDGDIGLIDSISQLMTGRLSCLILSAIPCGAIAEELTESGAESRIKKVVQHRIDATVGTAEPLSDWNHHL